MKHRKHLRAAAAGCAALSAALSVSALPPCSVLAAGTVVINEVCTKNTTAPAPDGAFYDYIELYNTGASEAAVGGYSLTDDPAMPAQYVLPAGTVIPAKGYLVVYCGVAADSTVGGAAFGLSKNGETIIFADAGGNELETVTVPALASDTAYGRIPDGGTDFGILSTLSAGKTNPAATAQIVAEAPVFSQESGFYASGFELTLSAPAGCTVYYTTDGSDPTTASEKYTAPIRIYDKSDEPNVYAAETDISSGYTPPSSPVNKAMIVRAVSVDGSGNQSSIVTNSYFIGYTQNDIEMKMRVISLVTDPDNLFDREKGIYVYGKVYEDWRNGPDYSPMTQSWEIPGNFTQSGREWERPAHMTVFEQGSAAYSADIGIRIHGGATRSSEQKSFNLYARLDYGTRKIEYDFFGGTLKNVNGKVIDSFDKLTLRNGGNDDKTKIRDRLNQEMVQDRAYAMQAQTECLVFLDGEFWGMYNIAEKLGKEFLADHFKVNEDSVCMIKTDELSDGTSKGWADYEALKDFALTADFTKAETVSRAAELVDLHSFADYMATELIVANNDFGNNNYALWKTETVDSTKEYADGKWRFILFDTEYGQGLYGQSDASTSTLTKMEQQAREGEWLPALFIGLMKTDNAFYRDFLACYYDQCNVNFAADRVTARLNELTEAYQPAMEATIERFSWISTGWGGWGGWGGPGGGQSAGSAASTFTDEVSTIRSFWQSRDARAEQIMLQWLGNSRIPQQLATVQIQSEQPVQFNTLTIPAGTWSGKYPQDIAYALTAPAGLTEWEVTGGEFAGGSASDRSVEILVNAQSAAIKANYGENVFSKSDVQALRDHLLTKKALTAEAAARYDLNGDKRLTAADLALLKRQV